MLVLVVVQVAIPPSNLDSLLALEVMLGIAMQLIQRRLDMLGVLGKSQYQFDRIDQQDQVAVIRVDFFVADLELWTPENWHG